MLKFFRKIRQRLLSEDRFSKYFLYALGEIVLVVIGILIALQVNTWNENRKDNDLELKLLKSLQKDLETDLTNISLKIELDSLIAQTNKALVRSFKNDHLEEGIRIQKYKGITYNSFGAVNRVMFFYPQKFAYQSIVNKGIDIIKNDSLRQEIVNLYDYQYRITEDYLNIQFDMFVNSNQTLWDFLETKDNVKVKIPNDTSLIKQNDRFLNFITHMAEEYEEVLDFYRNNRRKIRALIKKVDKEVQDH